MVNSKITAGPYNQSQKILATSTLFQRGKTQVPSKVRKKLMLSDGDIIIYIEEKGRIYIESNATINLP